MQALSPLAFLGGSIGPGELVILFAVILIFFGPKRLPEIARMIGRTLEELRRASQEFRDQVMNLDKEPGAPKPPEPWKNEPRPLPPPATEPNAPPNANAAPAPDGPPQPRDGLQDQQEGPDDRAG